MTITNSGESSVSVGTRVLLKVTKRTFQQKLHSSLTLGCGINEIGVKIRDINKYSIFKLDLKISRQTRSEASKNKVITIVLNTSIY